MMVRSLSTLLVVLLLVAQVMGFEYNCTFTDLKGNFYDLSPLSSCSPSKAYSVDTSEGSFSINVCNQVTGCRTNTAVCQSGTDAGSSTNMTISQWIINGESGVLLNYTGGSRQGCPGRRSRNTSIYFVCDPSATTPNITFLGENPPCSYNFQFASQYACPVQPAPQVQICPTYVYLVPHTHDDVGWIITADQYYQQEVKNILDTVVAALLANPARKFIYVEQAYFWRWWNDVNTTDTQRANFRTIYENGQLEFVIGGWVMQDEACTTYSADIDQMTLGHQFILNTFGAVPTKGWQIDPFGASSVTPTLNKLAGFDAHLIDRVSLKTYYESTHRLQFHWQGSPSLGKKSEIFTEIMNGGQNAYCEWLSAFGFGTNQPVNSSNVATFAQQFYSMVQSRAPNVLSNVMLAAWGCDFAFQNAAPMFASMDILIDYMQKNANQSHVIVKYATLSEYFAAVMAETDIHYPTNHGGDFFPLDESLYWTGYYTSRTELKGIVRQGEAASLMAEPLFAVSKLLGAVSAPAEAFQNLTVLRFANADAQHHDGVTGTSNPDVVLWYGDEINTGINAVSSTSAQILSSLISKGASTGTLTASYEALINLQPGEIIPVVVYNSLGWARNDYVVIPVGTQSVSVYDAYGDNLRSQVNPNYLSNAAAPYNLFFRVQIPAFGFVTYFVEGSSAATVEVHTFTLKDGVDTILTNDYLSLTLSGNTGLPSNLTNEIDSTSIDFQQNLLQYISAKSGAYAFGPKEEAFPITFQPPVTQVTQGPLVTEAYQVFGSASGSYAKQNIRLFSSPMNDPLVSNYVEFDFELGVLPSHIEVVSAFQTNIDNMQIFQTDDNGFEFLAREGLFNIGIEGNYYPTIYASFIRDDLAQLSVFSERTHGVSSLANGEIELMIHRNPDMGDGFGPSLTDTTVVYPVLRVSLESPHNSSIITRRAPLVLNFPLTVFSGPSISSISAWAQSYEIFQSFFNGSLPPNVHFLSLNALDGTNNRTAIFRLTHLFAAGEDPVFSEPATVDVAALFKFSIASFVETTLTANQVIANPASTTVTLHPKEIRTFVIRFS